LAGPETVVGIEHRHVGGGDRLEGEVAGARGPGPDGARGKEAEAAVDQSLGGEPRLVILAVVADDHQLPARPGLGEDAAYARGDETAGMVGRHDDRKGCWHADFPGLPRT